MASLAACSRPHRSHIGLQQLSFCICGSLFEIGEHGAHVSEGPVRSTNKHQGIATHA